MIIRTNKIRLFGSDNKLIHYSEEGDKFTATTAQLIGPVLAEAQDERNSGRNGWTKDKGFRRIASIPAIEFSLHPEIAHDAKAMKKFLQNEGRHYLTVTKGFY